MFAKEYTVKGNIEIFPQKGGWYYVSVPKQISTSLSEFADRGLIAITATAKNTSWDTSLLPMGDGTCFIALNKKVMAKEDLKLGDKIKIQFKLRER